MKRSMVSMRSFNESRMNESFISNASNLSQMRKVYLKKIAKLENEIYEILKLLDTNHPVLSPQEIETKVIEHCKWLEKEYKAEDGYKKLMPESEYLLLESIKLMV